MEWTDAEAAAEVCLGNRHAFRVLVERHSTGIFRLAFLMTGNEQDAEDVVQETFLRSFKQLHTFDGSRAAFATWLHRICVNCSLNLIRSRKSRREQPPARTEEEGLRWLEQIAAHTPSPERLAHSAEMAELVRVALKELTNSELSAFILRHYEGRPTEEIASTLGLPPGAAKQAVFRAVQKLRRALQPAWELKR